MVVRGLEYDSVVESEGWGLDRRLSRSNIASGATDQVDVKQSYRSRCQYKKSCGGFGIERSCGC